jgi:hypothetical protein
MFGLTLGTSEALRGFALRRLDLERALPVALVLVMLAAPYLSPVWIRVGPPSEPGVVAHLGRLAEWLREHTTRTARIAFCERSPGPYSGAKLRFHLERELIGGPFFDSNLAHGSVNFLWNSYLGPGGPTEIDADTFLRRSSLYNVGWVVSSDHSVSQALRHLAPEIVHMASIEGPEPLEVFEIRREHDYFLEGSGKASARLNEIQLEDVSPGGVVLKYHWLETFVTDPPLAIERHEVPGDPVGFIRVHNSNVSAFRIRNSYEPIAPTRADEWARRLDVFGLSYPGSGP